MKRSVLSLFVAIGLAGAALAAQSTPPYTPSTPAQPAPRPAAASATPQQMQDQMLSGCLVQGSTPTVFILENAKLSSAERAEKGTSYIVVASGTSVDLKSQLNHQVTVAVPGETKLVVVAPAPGAPAPVTVAKIEEKDMSKVTARSIVKIADTCTTVG